jgi:hypothetical protein
MWRPSTSALRRRRTAISFGAYCLNSAAAFSSASASVTASTSLIHVCRRASLQMLKLGGGDGARLARHGGQYQTRAKQGANGVHSASPFSAPYLDTAGGIFPGGGPAGGTDRVAMRPIGLARQGERAGAGRPQGGGPEGRDDRRGMM